MPPRIPRRAQVTEILSRFRSAGTEREKRKVANSIKKDFPEISARLTKLINEEGSCGRM